ncbi:hypothetical protein [Thermomonospora cellulosilytica]|uniref:Uncharacterized protein n=1 Tax=Thermomonospora cellulosilytica TaxID=1411118 RepID=A0A7W3MST4_9ACTN|nr:hypothetical protein [Thermomonospora cellulosilytica]MBA9001224.1 hypothetical protein [Thermomonospora cellulosilytica]
MDRAAFANDRLPAVPGTAVVVTVAKTTVVETAMVGPPGSAALRPAERRPVGAVRRTPGRAGETREGRDRRRGSGGLGGVRGARCAVRSASRMRVAATGPLIAISYQ